MTRLVLASTSRYRAELLSRLGVPFDAIAPSFDEEARKREDVPIRELALSLARGKASSVAVDADDVVIGSDQIATIDGARLSKPGTRARAIEQLERLAGRTHELVTAVVVKQGGRTIEHVDTTRLTMRALDRTALERYVDRDAPLDCAGSYAIERAGIALFERIESDDHTAIVGLPLLALTRALGELGFVIP